MSRLRGFLLFIFLVTVLSVFLLPTWIKKTILSGQHPYTINIVASEIKQKSTVPSLKEGIGIPRTIVITNKKHGPMMRDRALLWEKMNVGYTVLQFDDHDCANFLATEYDTFTKSVFMSIANGPIKADMFRVFYLLKMGGIYVDVDMIPIQPLNVSMTTLNDTMPQLLIPKSRHKNFLNPTIIASSPEHPTLMMAAQCYLKLGRGFYYSYWSWSAVHILSALYHAGAPITLSLSEKCPNLPNTETCGLYYKNQLQMYLRGAGWDQHTHSQIFNAN